MPSNICPSLEQFQKTHTSGSLEAPHHDFSQDFFLNSDPRLKLSGSFHSPLERLLELDVDMQADGDWVGLHSKLSVTNLTDFTYVGFVCRAASSAPLMVKACLRSGLPEGGFVDSFFTKHLLTSDRSHTHLDAMYLDSEPSVPFISPWRELILFLPCKPFRLSIAHLHPFAI